eukprot:m.42539 g.42539  ORF g.42539 m.42539 type:complete len:206 (-) comp46455_c0_seq1:88-705(-)
MRRTMKSACRKPTMRPLVFAGPSGAGKSTLVKRLFKDFPGVFAFSVSHTTRKPRAGETNGVEYHFTTKEELEDAVTRGEFIESTTFAGNMYGTSKKAVQDIISLGKTCILDIDIKGCESMRHTDLNARFLMILPPSIAELERRLRNRGTETETTIAARLAVAEEEILYGRIPGKFDEVIVNDDLEEAYQRVVAFLRPDIDAHATH